MKKLSKKFKPGDWIVHEFGVGCTEISQVTGIKDGRYILSIGSWEIRKCNKFARLWRIEDAKPGDILASRSGDLCIFRDIYPRYPDCIFVYFILYRSGKFGEYPYSVPFSGVRPATQSQKIALMETIDDLGYEWNPELLEFKKTKGYWIKKLKNLWKK